MKIEINNEKGMYFGAIDPGTTFYHNKNYYLKCRRTIAFNNANAVNLRDGEVTKYTDDIRVKLVPLKIVEDD